MSSQHKKGPLQNFRFATAPFLGADVAPHENLGAGRKTNRACLEHREERRESQTCHNLFTENNSLSRKYSIRLKYKK